MQIKPTGFNLYKNRRSIDKKLTFAAQLLNFKHALIRTSCFTKSKNKKMKSEYLSKFLKEGSRVG